MKNLKSCRDCMICGSEAQKKDMCKWDICIFIYRQKKECVIDRLETRGNRGFFARPNSPRRTNTIPLSPVTGITFKKYTMQQFLLLLTPPRFSIGYTALNILHIQGLLHATPYAFSFMLEYTRHKIFLSCHIYNMLKKYSFWRKKKKIFFCSLRLYPTEN